MCVRGFNSGVRGFNSGVRVLPVPPVGRLMCVVLENVREGEEDAAEKFLLWGLRFSFQGSGFRG